MKDLQIFRNSVSQADTIIRLLSEKEDDFIRIFRVYQDDAVTVALQLGSDAMYDLEKYGLDFLGGLRTHTDDFVRLYQKYSSDFAGKYVSYGGEIFTYLTKYGDDYERLLMGYEGDVLETVMKGLRTHGDDFMELFQKHGDDFIYTYRKNGDAVIRSGCVIIKEESNQIFYVNKAGTTVRIPKQSQKVIDELIKKELNDPNLDEGKQVEVKVAAYLRKELEVDLTEFQLKIDAGKNSGNNLGDIDCATKDFLIEVKKSVSEAKSSQIKKYINSMEEKYFNVYAKEVILYIDEPITEIGDKKMQELDEIRKMGVEIVNGLEELKGVLE